MTNGGSRIAAALALAASLGLAQGAYAADRHAVPHGGGSRVAPSAPSHGVAQRSPAPARGHANGTARYGYGGFSGRGGFYGGYFGDPWWGFGWDPWWSVGFHYGWPYYGRYGFYGAPYAYYRVPYDYDVEGDGGGGGYSGVPSSAPAIVETDVAPKRADLLLDGENIGQAKDFNGTWDTLSVDPGHHTLEFREDGYRSLVIDLNAQPGRHYVFRDTLAEGTGEEHRTVGQVTPPAPPAAPPRIEVDSDPPPPDREEPRRLAKGLLRVHATPDDASVYLDGEFLGLARELARLHGAIPVAAGEHRIELARPGYAGVTKRVSVSGEGTTEVSISLERER